MCPPAAYLQQKLGHPGFLRRGPKCLFTCSPGMALLPPRRGPQASLQLFPGRSVLCVWREKLRRVSAQHFCGSLLADLLQVALIFPEFSGIEMVRFEQANGFRH